MQEGLKTQYNLALQYTFNTGVKPLKYRVKNSKSQCNATVELEN